MELQNIEILTQKYLEGETSLKEEDQLRHYYLSDNVAPHLESYKPLFNYFAKAKKNSLQLPPIPHKPLNLYLNRGWLLLQVLF